MLIQLIRIKDFESDEYITSLNKQTKQYGGTTMDNNRELTQTEEIKVTNWDEALEKECWVAPLVDICETEDDYTLVANMPGVSKENVRIKVEDGNLIIMGRIDYDQQVQKKYVLNETEIGNYCRKFRISDSIDESRIEAHLENGQLIINLPKHERVKPRTIEIK